MNDRADSYPMPAIRQIFERHVAQARFGRRIEDVELPDEVTEVADVLLPGDTILGAAREVEQP